MPATHPAAGTYHLTPDPIYNMPAYEVVVEDDALEQPGTGLTAKPWSEEHGAFCIFVESGAFGFRCYGGAYVHFSIDTRVTPPVLLTLDHGTCEPA